MQPVLFDTSVYIAALGKADRSTLTLRNVTETAPLWLSAVVLEELYAGVSEKNRDAIERLQRDFDRAKRIAVPNLTDCSQTGTALSRLAAKYGYEETGRGRLTNDALIAASAGRLGIRVFTANERDFSRLAEFVNFQWSVIGV